MALLSVICQTKKQPTEGKTNYWKTKQDRSKASNGFKNNFHTNNKIKQEMDYFIVILGIEVSGVTNAEAILKMHKHIFFTGQI